MNNSLSESEFLSVELQDAFEKSSSTELQDWQLATHVSLKSPAPPGTPGFSWRINHESWLPVLEPRYWLSKGRE